MAGKHIGYRDNIRGKAGGTYLARISQLILMPMATVGTVVSVRRGTQRGPAEGVTGRPKQILEVRLRWRLSRGVRRAGGVNDGSPWRGVSRWLSQGPVKGADLWITH